MAQPGEAAGDLNRTPAKRHIRQAQFAAFGFLIIKYYRMMTGPGGQIRCYIGCDPLACERGNGWGYKNLYESMGLAIASAQWLVWIMVQVTNPEWRERSRVWHAARNRKAAVGDVLVLAGLSIPEPESSRNTASHHKHQSWRQVGTVNTRRSPCPGRA